MATISERVRLEISIIGAPQGSRTMKGLEDDLNKLKAAFKSGQITAQQFSSSVQASIGDFGGATAEAGDQLELFTTNADKQLELFSDKAVAAMSKAQQAMSGGVDATGGMAEATEDLNAIQQRNTEINTRANLLLIDFSRISQDAVYGMRAMINNFDPLILNFARFRAAVAAANGGVITFATTLTALKQVLLSPAGLLVFINLLFLIGSLTDVLDPVKNAISDLFNLFRDTNKEADDLRKKAKEGIADAVRLQDSVTPTQAVESWRELNEQVNELTQQKTLNTINRLGLALNEMAIGADLTRVVFGQTSAGLAEENERIAEQIERFESLREVFQQAALEWEQEQFIINLGRLDIQTPDEIKVINTINDVNDRILELQQKVGDDSIEIQQKLIAHRTDVEIQGLRQEQEIIEDHLERRRQLYVDKLEEINEATTAEEIEQTRKSLAIINRHIALYETAIEDINEVIARIGQFSQDEQDAVLAEFNNRISSMIQDISEQTEQNLILAKEDGVEKRIELLEFETEQEIVHARQRIEQHEETYGPNGALRETTDDYIASLRRKLVTDKAAIYKEEADKESDRINRLKNIVENQLAELRASSQEIEIQLDFSGVEESVRLLEHSVDVEEEALRRQLRQFEQQYGPNGELSAAIDSYINLLREKLVEDKQEILDEDADREREHLNNLIQIQEELAIAYGASTEAIINNRLERQQALLEDIPEEDVEERRRVIESIQKLEVDLTRIRQEQVLERRDIAFENIRNERDFQRAVEDTQLSIRSSLASTIREERNILRERKAITLERIAATRQEAEEYERIEREITSIREELASTDISDERRQVLSEQLAILEGRLDLSREAIREYQNLLIDLLNIEGDIANQEQDIWDRRTKQITSFVDDAIGEFLRLSNAQQQFTELDIELQEFQFRQREQQLRESLRESEVTWEEYSLQVRKLSQDRAEFEKDVERDRVSVVKQLTQELTQTLIQESISRIAQFIIETTIKETVGKVAVKNVSNTVKSEMAQVTAAAAPAAAATSIATFGGAALAGAAAAAGAIALIYAAIRGFEEGGYTGNKGQKQVAGVVHGGEFVFTKRAVQNNPEPFYKLMVALEQGLNPEKLLAFLQILDYPAKTNIFRTAGLMGNGSAQRGFAEGGFVGTAILETMNVPVDDSPNSSLTEAKMDRETLSVLREMVERLETLEFRVTAGRRTQDQIVRGGQAYHKRKTVSNRFRRLN